MQKLSDGRTIGRINLESDFDSFAELLRLSFGSGVTVDRKMYRWYLDANPYNYEGANMMYVMKDGEKVIAADGLFPFDLSIDGAVYRSAHSVLSMTHPDYKRQGIFRKMTEHSLERAREAGIDLVLGLANKNSYGAYEKFGWQTLFEKSVFIRPIHVYGRLRRKLRVTLAAGIGAALFHSYDAARKYFLDRRGRGYATVLFDRVPEESGECFGKCVGSYKNLIVRDFKYLDYRYNQRPDKKYKTIALVKDDMIVGFSVLRECPVGGHTMVSVAEFFCDPAEEAAINALISGVVEFAYGCGAEYAVVCVGGEERLCYALQRAGFSKNKKPLLNNMMISCAVSDVAKERLAGKILSGDSRWYITQGDGETELHF